MPQYQVTMNLVRADPLLDIGQLTEIVTQAILPSLEALQDLQSKGKVLAGGHPVGQRYVVMFMEAASEEEVRELLKEYRPHRPQGSKSGVLQVIRAGDIVYSYRPQVGHYRPLL